MPDTINIDLWFWKLDAPPQTIDRWSSYLSAEEEARRARFVFDKDRARFAICRSRMRRILGWYISTPPRDIEFATTGRGKPVLGGATSTPVQFNLTHTTGLACLAVSASHAVGVDLEQVRELKDEFIAHTLNPAEQSLVMPVEQDLRSTAFLRAWTAKEAYLKCLGNGLWQSLKTFDVRMPSPVGLREFAPGELTRIDDAEQRARNWQLYTFQATNTHVGALAIAPPEGTKIRIRPNWLGMDGAD